MEEEMFEVKPDEEKAKSILKMVKTRLEMLNTIDTTRFSSPVLEGHYEIIKELMTVILLLDGKKTLSHKTLIEYLDKNYSQFKRHEISLIDELRVVRNKISYNGFFITEDYMKRKKKNILDIISKLKHTAESKLKNR